MNLLENIRNIRNELMIIFGKYLILWCRKEESNLRPTDYECNAPAIYHYGCSFIYIYISLQINELRIFCHL
jgi:hypothetical protein